jgi:hypothetical protein
MAARTEAEVRVGTIENAASTVGASPRARVLITGTGRAGTTLLVQVLTDLGFDTGFAADAPIDERVHAGLEQPLDDPGGPRIVKNPTVIRRLDALLGSGHVALEHVVIPIRDLDVAAASRVRNTRYGTNLTSQGGLVGTRNAAHQREALALLQYELFRVLAEHDIPHTLLAFPRFTTDAEYTYRKLSFLDPAIPPERWQDALARRVRPGLIHETALSRRERMLAGLGSTYNRALVRPARALRRLLPGSTSGAGRP